MRVNKKIIAVVGAIVLAAGGGYFYFVYLPMQEEAEQANQQATMSNVKSAPGAQLAKSALPASAVAAVPAAVQTVPASAVPESASASVTPPSAPIAAVVATVPAPIASPQPVAPMDSQSVAAEAEEKTSDAPDSPPQHQSDSAMASPPESRNVPVVTRAPETEYRVIKTKYNDIMTAVLRGDQDGVKQLLDLGWWVDKPSTDGLTPLIAAVMNRDTQMVLLLLDHGAIPSSQALKLARDKKDVATEVLLEQRGAR